MTDEMQADILDGLADLLASQRVIRSLVTVAAQDPIATQRVNKETT